MKGTSHVGHRIERRPRGRTEQRIRCTELDQRQGVLVAGAFRWSAVCLDGQAGVVAEPGLVAEPGVGRS